MKAQNGFNRDKMIVTRQLVADSHVFFIHRRNNFFHDRPLPCLL